MKLDSVLGAGLKGIQEGLESATRHTQEIATAFNSPNESDVVSSLIGLSQDERQVEASSKLVKLSEDLSKTVLDILA